MPGTGAEKTWGDTGAQGLRTGGGVLRLLRLAKLSGKILRRQNHADLHGPLRISARRTPVGYRARKQLWAGRVHADFLREFFEGFGRFARQAGAGIRGADLAASEFEPGLAALFNPD